MLVGNGSWLFTILSTHLIQMCALCWLASFFHRPHHTCNHTDVPKPSEGIPLRSCEGLSVKLQHHETIDLNDNRTNFSRKEKITWQHLIKNIFQCQIKIAHQIILHFRWSLHACWEFYPIIYHIRRVSYHLWRSNCSRSFLLWFSSTLSYMVFFNLFFLLAPYLTSLRDVLTFQTIYSRVQSSFRWFICWYISWTRRAAS